MREELEILTIFWGSFLFGFVVAYFIYLNL